MQFYDINAQLIGAVGYTTLSPTCPVGWDCIEYTDCFSAEE